jgi:hypothetical protein
MALASEYAEVGVPYDASSRKMLLTRYGIICRGVIRRRIGLASLAVDLLGTLQRRGALALYSPGTK